MSSNIPLNIFVVGACVLLVILLVLTSGCTTENNKEIDENKPPVADAGSDISVKVGEVFSYGGSGSDIYGQIVSYEWDVDGDGTYDMLCPNCGMDSYQFDSPGTYQATLRVTDNDGATDTDVCTVTVS